MRILNFKAENFKKIVAIDITPKGNVVIISGKNGAGKTSAIDAIWSTLQWRAGKKINPAPIRKGEKFANVTITFEDFIVCREWFDNGNTRLKVTNREGFTPPSPPQELIDKFIGVLSFDPSVFYAMTPKEQRDIFLKITGVDVDFYDDKIANIYATRKVKGQEVKMLAGEREEVAEGLPEVAVDISGLSDSYDKAIWLNNKIQKAQLDYKSNTIHISNNEGDIQNLKNQILDLEDENKETIKENDKIKEWFTENKPVETELLKDKITNAYEINKQIEARGRNNQKFIKHNKAKAEYEEFTKQIATIEDDKKKALEGSKLTIKDLTVDNEGLKRKGFPISQLAESDKILLAMEIGMTLNPEFKCIFLRNYTLLDSDSKKVVDDFAEKYDYQVICEQVDSTGEVGFYIEEGKVANDN